MMDILLSGFSGFCFLKSMLESFHSYPKYSEKEYAQGIIFPQISCYVFFSVKICFFILLCFTSTIFDITSSLHSSLNLRGYWFCTAVCRQQTKIGYSCRGSSFLMVSHQEQSYMLRVHLLALIFL